MCVSADVSVHEIEDVPRNYKAAVTGPEKDKWIPSIESELKSLDDNGTWELVIAPQDTKLVSTKWIFRKKINPDGSIRYKSRLVARGFTQVEVVDFFKTY